MMNNFLNDTKLAIDTYKEITSSNCNDIIIKSFRNIGANLNWYIKDNLMEFVLKRYYSKQKVDFVNQEIFSSILYQSGIPIPKIIEKGGEKKFYLNGYWWQLLEFAEGRQYEIGNQKDIINAALLLKELHNIPYNGVAINTLHDPIYWINDPEKEMDMFMITLKKYDKFDDYIICKMKKLIKKILLKCTPSIYYDLPHTIVHGDYHGNNLLFNKDGNICCLLDLESVNYSPRVVDVAQGAFLMSRSKNEIFSINRNLVSLFIDTYGKLTKLELQMLIPILQLRFLPRAPYIEELGKVDRKKIDNEITWSFNAVNAIENQVNEIIFNMI